MEARHFLQAVRGTVLGLAVCLAGSCTGQQKADLALINGKVFVGGIVGDFAEAVAVRGERILAVGSTAEIERVSDAGTKRIDVQGRLIIPGINDGHTHSLFLPPYGRHLQFESMNPAWDETLSAVAAATREAAAGTWIFGVVGETIILGSEASRFGLDEAAPDHPVYLGAYYGHGDLVNTKAMTELEIGDEEPDPEGGFYLRSGDSNRLNGKLFEYAQWRQRARLMNDASDQELIERLQEFSRQAVAFGITSIQDMPLLPLGRYLEILEKAELPIRVRAIHMPLVQGEAPEFTGESSRIRAHGSKWILDGTPIEHGGALRGGYADRPDLSGRLNFPESKIREIVELSLVDPNQLLLHCVGDRTVAAVFDAMEQHAVDWREKRVRIEHGDGVAGDLIQRAHDLGAIIVQNPTHLAARDLIHSRFGSESLFFSLRSLRESGIAVALGSDGALNPYLNIMLATLHPARPSEALTRTQAVEAYTRVTAFAEFQEADKGVVEAGKLADLAVLSQDIFAVPTEALPATRSILTLVGGQVVLDAGQLN